MDADVGDVAPGPDELGALLERLGDADRFYRHVGAEAVGELGNGACRVGRTYR